MALGFNGIPSAEVTIDGGISIASVEAINVHKNSTGTMGTVPTGKKWKIIDLCIVGYSTGGTDQSYITMGGTSYLHIVPDEATNSQYARRNWSISACPVLTAGETIVFTEGGSANAWVSYVEEDV